MNITNIVQQQWSSADSAVVNVLRETPNLEGKGTADSRYLWPTVVFEKVCQCNESYGGYDCMECDYGWTNNGAECQRQEPVVRKSFAKLSETEKANFINATRNLKKEMGVWSVIVNEPESYTNGTVTLQNVTTYDFFVYLHNFVSRDDSGACTEINQGNIVDFAHVGPVFPVWHRRYLLTVEREFQRIMNDGSFGFPYWQWEEGDMSPFTEENYGVPANSFNSTATDIHGDLINPTDWNTICDLGYQNPRLNGCLPYWKPCNPANDLAAARSLQRGKSRGYLPNQIEVMIAIAAPSYDAADSNGDYQLNSPRTSFRSRMEGWNRICSAGNCVGQHYESHMHNVVHLWVGGQMSVVPSAVNDPIFNLHHCNVDRVLESWMKRFYGNKSSNPELLPAYVPVTGGHPGHNRDDFMVPFFPLIMAGRQYAAAEEWGYRYDHLVPALIDDSTIQDCSEIYPDCPTCNSVDDTCINCTTQTCPAPRTLPEEPAEPSQNSLTGPTNDSLVLYLGFGLGLGIPLLLSLVTVVVLVAVLCTKRKARVAADSRSETHEMTAVNT